MRALGLDAMELEFVYGVRLKPERAVEIGELARKEKVHLSCHAPYYINLNSTDPAKLEASKKRILDSAMVGSMAGAESIVFHTGFYQGLEKEAVYRKVKQVLRELVAKLQEQNIRVVLRPETTGKASQFGSLPELMALAQEVEQLLPCVDFAHLHAREGKMNTSEEFQSLLSGYEEELGRESLKRMHCHLAGIAYTPKGEKNHLNLQESDMNFHHLLEAMKAFNCQGVLISESPNLEVDALLLQSLYRKL